jgi:hypothetical protein
MPDSPTNAELFQAHGAPVLAHNLNRVTVLRSRPTRLPDGQGGSEESLDYSDYDEITCDPIIQDSVMMLSLAADEDVQIGDLILIENL